MAAFTIENLTFFYPLRETAALKNISFTVEYGEFVTVCGKSGCGKSTLLRNLKPVLAPYGKREGEILFYGRKLSEVDSKEQSKRIGYVLQNPDNQIVTDKVWHELAFGLESLGYDTKTIRLRVAEMASFFGIQSWFLKSVAELSGGQKQLLNLASIMAMQPDILILDEPTSQLDPISAADFLETVKKINREIGTTVIMTEHRLEEVFPVSDRILVLDQGELILNDAPQKVGEALRRMGHVMFKAMPSPMQIYEEVKARWDRDCPITVRDGRNWMTAVFEDSEVRYTAVRNSKGGEGGHASGAGFVGKDDRALTEGPSGKGKGTQARAAGEENRKDPAVELKEVWFQYDKREPFVIKDLSLRVPEHELFCIVGGNGTGKTTALTLIGGINRPQRGKVLIHGKEMSKYTEKELFRGLIGVLPQNPQSLFVEKTVQLDLLEILDRASLSKEEKAAKVRAMAELVEIGDLLGMHPYDISGGEQQRAALAKVLLLEPRILLLDEPTKGIDSHFKEKLAEILRKLLDQGVSVIMVSHDIEFCARYADRCAMFFDGNVVTTNSPNQFFSGNSFYTTAANRMSRHIFENAVTAKDVIDLCQQNLGKAGA
jgi:energy-coupling factor transport system ATP-binding protein